MLYQGFYATLDQHVAPYLRLLTNLPGLDLKFLPARIPWPTVTHEATYPVLGLNWFFVSFLEVF